VHLEFAAPTKAQREGWNRRYVLELNGWCKDRDLYTKDGSTLDPLPSREGATPDSLKQRDALHAQFNTRFRSGG
jgi:hypothetical protein